MSYILEALKKSEQERARERGALPDIQSVHKPSSSLHNENRRWWPFVLIGVLIVAGAGLTALYVTRLQPVDQQAKSEMSAPVAAVDEKKTEFPLKKQDAKPVTPAMTKKSVVEQKSSSVTEQKQPSVVFSEQRLQRDDVLGNVDEQLKQEDEERTIPAGKVTIEQNIEQTTVAISDIPDSVRKKIPSIAFEGHVYSSNPDSRSVMINGRKRREGDTIGGDLLLKEITADGAEFEIQGYRFRLNALQDWSLK